MTLACEGPGGFGEFATKEAQLSSKAEADRPLREHIFEALRRPDFEDKDQANVKFMPRLSGDNGVLSSRLHLRARTDTHNR